MLAGLLRTVLDGLSVADRPASNVSLEALDDRVLACELALEACDVVGYDLAVEGVDRM
jgi:hypothetical protein